MEGQDDLRVVKNLCERLTLALNFCIQDKKGFEKLAQSIPLEVKAPGRIVLGIMVDANDDPDARWQSIATRLHSAGIETPETRETAGTVIDGSPRVGIWLMPDNQSKGELEDFVTRLVPESDPVWPLADEYIERIPSEDRKFKSHKVSRAKLSAWLATREDPRQMGLAISTGDLDASREPAPTFAEWLRRTFG